MTEQSVAPPEPAALAVASLTPTQLRRAMARLEGQPLAVIAARENCSVQSVHECLHVPKVRAAVTILGQSLAVIDPETAQEVDLFTTLLNNVAEIALSATRAVQVGNELRTIPDYRLRLDASAKLLALATPLNPEKT